MWKTAFKKFTWSTLEYFATYVLEDIIHCYTKFVMVASVFSIKISVENTQFYNLKKWKCEITEIMEVE